MDTIPWNIQQYRHNIPDTIIQLSYRHYPLCIRKLGLSSFYYFWFFDITIITNKYYKLS